MFAARIASAPKNASPTTRSAQAAGERASGTDGTSRGTRMPTALTATIAATTTPTSQSRKGIERRPLNTARPESASTAAPIGSVVAPVNATTPFCPTITPGVTRPCTASRAAMIVNPPATTTVRASPRRAPMVMSVSAAAAAARALTPTP